MPDTRRGSQEPLGNLEELDWTGVGKYVEEIIDKKPISLRLDSDVLEYFRSTGHGYQTRINAVLRFYMDQKKQEKEK